MYSELQETVAAITALTPEVPVVGLVLGSGLGAYADTFERRTVVP